MDNVLKHNICMSKNDCNEDTCSQFAEEFHYIIYPVLDIKIPTQHTNML
jgi:hypothetical protein